MKTFIITICIVMFTYVNSNSQGNSWEWFNTLPGIGTTSMAMNESGDLFFTTASYNYPTGQSAGVYRVFNGSFIVQPSNPVSGMMYNARTIEAKGNYVWASCWPNPSTDQEALYYSTNKGNTWTRTFQAGENNNIFDIEVDLTNVYIGTRGKLYKSTNNGVNFTQTGNGINPLENIYDICIILNKIFIATAGGVFFSTDEGNNFTKIQGIPDVDSPKVLTPVIENGMTGIAAGTANGKVYYEIDETPGFQLLYGWESAAIIGMLTVLSDQPDVEHYIISALPGNFDNLGVGMYYSYNNLTGWTDFGAGLPAPYTVSAIAGRMQGSNMTLFAGTFDNTSNGVKIYKRNYTVGIKNLSSEIPASYSLSQNYPNPFNPVTKIKFQVYNTSDINITVYNSLGKEVKTLVKEKLSPGTYESDFDGSSFSSGVYFYRLNANEISGNTNSSFTETKSMVLIK